MKRETERERKGEKQRRGEKEIWKLDSMSEGSQQQFASTGAEITNIKDNFIILYYVSSNFGTVPMGELCST